MNPAHPLVEGHPVIGVWPATYPHQTRVFDDRQGDDPGKEGSWVQLVGWGVVAAGGPSV